MSKKLIASGVLAGLLATAGAVGVVAAQSANAPAPALSEAQAIEIALNEVPGEVQEVELDREDGMQVYEIEIMAADGSEMEVEISAETGDVLEVEAEKDDDCA